MPKILVIRFSSIGDIVLTTPVFRLIKKQVEQAELHFVTKLRFKAVTSENPYIDKFHYLDEDWEGLIDALKKENYDVVIDLHNNFRSNKIRRALKARSSVIDKLTVPKFFLTKLGLNFMPNRHITQRCIDAAKILGVQDDGHGLDYYISKSDEVSFQDIPTSHHAGYIGIVIGANHRTKKLPVHQLKKLCAYIQHPIILLGGPGEATEGDEIAATDQAKIYNAAGKFSLNECADLIKKAKLIVSHDTGMQYIACAYQRPVIAVWGSTSPKLQVEPYYGTDARYQGKYENFLKNLHCQPCNKYGAASCPREHFNCMEKLSMQDLAHAVHRRLGRAVS